MLNDDRLPLKLKFLEYFKEVPIQKFAAGHIGRNENTIKVWKDEDPDFLDCIEEAKSAFVRKSINDVRSKEWLLERIFKGDFAQRSELTGKDGESLTPLLVRFIGTDVPTTKE